MGEKGVLIGDPLDESVAEACCGTTPVSATILSGRQPDDPRRSRYDELHCPFTTSKEVGTRTAPNNESERGVFDTKGLPPPPTPPVTVVAVLVEDESDQSSSNSQGLKQTFDWWTLETDAVGVNTEEVMVLLPTTAADAEVETAAVTVLEHDDDNAAAPEEVPGPTLTAPPLTAVEVLET